MVLQQPSSSNKNLYCTANFKGNIRAFTKETGQAQLILIKYVLLVEYLLFASFPHYVAVCAIMIGSSKTFNRILRYDNCTRPFYGGKINIGLGQWFRGGKEHFIFLCKKN